MRPRHDSWFEQPGPPDPPGFEAVFGDLMKAFSQSLPEALSGLALSAGVRPPAVDVLEDPGAYIVEADLPGLAREQLTIEFEDGVLTLAGTWPARDGGHGGDTGGTLHRHERARGAFRRELRFAVPIDGSAVTADLTDGLLTIRLPKAPQAGRRSISIDPPAAD